MEHLQYPAVFIFLLFHRGKSQKSGEKVEAEVGDGSGWGGGGFQSDRPTEEHDNERLGLPRVQTPFPLCDSWKDREWNEEWGRELRE